MNEKKSLDDVAVKMSLRLRTVADMLRGDGAHKCTADVGCDHGYVSIYLVQNKISESAIAMDVRKGPLAMAESNIREYSLEKDIQTRL
ncbi:MAG: tRNA (adenine(22)-N(1))-methyltransferase TrmK, partial [Butyrivibrio sp.]|nr:tRNA (adenine(22)-N(1))-methyltransferase TrmK [Butyrivibrio sp.]